MRLSCTGASLFHRRIVDAIGRDGFGLDDVGLELTLLPLETLIAREYGDAGSRARKRPFGGGVRR
ncbi:hypothetical protein K678_06235 [Magnetospirillum fulvum MGU-K5]|uniref:Uncharacterized protein n=1 Tax=Magnetospirillum fulvum MGU-K5 TaxID=1316936 RepID=S9SC99_MAGFU|nr:hypothetical protein K678_06235 [Magnetospirillum fulvum MGU-K5]